MYKAQENLSSEDLEKHLETLEISHASIKETVRVLKIIYMHKYLFSYEVFNLGELRDILKVINQPYTNEQKKQMRVERRKMSKMQRNEHDKNLLANTEMKKRKDEEKKRIIMKLPSQKIVSFLENLSSSTNAKNHIQSILNKEWDPDNEFENFPIDEDELLKLDLVTKEKNEIDIKKNLVAKMVGFHALNDDLSKHLEASEIPLAKQVEQTSFNPNTSQTTFESIQKLNQNTNQEFTDISLKDENNSELQKPIENTFIFTSNQEQNKNDEMIVDSLSNNNLNDDEVTITKESSDILKNEKLIKPRKCYCCKQMYDKIHFFYNSMCIPCGDYNYRKRNQTGDLTGKFALVTGSRVKIGFCVVLKLLRAGATVIATTRFPKDAARRYSLEHDYSQWKDRLVIYGLDLRHSPSVHYFCMFIRQKYQRLDILINNAAQTLKRKPNFFSHLLPIETKSLEELNEDIQYTLGKDWTMKFTEITPEALEMGKKLTNEENRIRLSEPLPNIVAARITYPNLSESALLCQVGVISPADTDPSNFPEGALDLNGEQIDYSEKNTWISEIDEIGYLEFMEVQTINMTAPWILIKELKPLMCVDDCAKYIVSVN